MITTITKEHLLQEIPEGSYIVMDGYFRAHFEEKLSKHYVYWLHEAETSKNLTIFEDICSYFLSHGVDRQSTIWAIGGGATSDLAGFVAATLLRGISWRVVPTTLLSQLDASLGGKVAVNHDSGKNLIGKSQSSRGEVRFTAFNPNTNQPLDTVFCEATKSEIDDRSKISARLWRPAVNDKYKIQMPAPVSRRPKNRHNPAQKPLKN